MAKILEMPKLSPTMEEGLLSVWHRKEGDAVVVDDLLAEVETDKATMEYRAFDAGTLLRLLVTAGSTVKLGQPVAILGAPGEDIEALLAQAKARIGASPAQPSASPPTVPAREPKPVEEAPPEAAPPQPRVNILSRTEEAPEATGADGRVLASPHVRQSARAMGIDLSGARGSGKNGRVVPEDLERLRSTKDSTALAHPGAPKGPPGLREPEVRPLSPMRKTIARRLVLAKSTIPHFYLTIDVDAEALVKLREGINHELAAGERKSEGEKPLKVSLNDLLIKAVATALGRVPECNAQYTESAILVFDRVDVSVAVAVPDGLVTPVVRDADRKSVVGIAREVRDLAARARAKKLSPEEMTNGTFSISNLGMFGVDAFAAVINPPEGAILAVGQVRDEPVVRENAVVPGKKLAMTLSCDHRVVDGAIGAAFLAELRTLIEHPMRILTG